MTDPEWRSRYESRLGQMTVERPGNFGGKAYTNQLLEYFLHVSQSIIAASRDITFFNCSDGVRIEHTIPKAPKAVRLTSTMVDRRDTIPKILAAAPPRAAGDMIDRQRAYRFQAMYRDWQQDITSKLIALEIAGADLIAIHDAVAASIDAGEEMGEARGIGTTSRGSLSLMLLHALQCAIRHDLLADREMLSAVTTGLREAVSAMADAVDNMIGDTLGPVSQHG